MVWHWLFGLGAGYLIGSISPAFVLGKLLQGIDIRTVNYRNAGTRNVKKSLGLWPAVITAIIDTGKGIAAVIVVEVVTGNSGYVLLAPAVASIAGHIFPFYLRFRGGRGTATAVGLFLYIAGLEIAGGAYPWYVFLCLLVVSGLVYLGTRSGDATALFAFLGMMFTAVVELGLSVTGSIALVASAYAFVHALFRGRDLGLYKLPAGAMVLGWRAKLRPLALLFVPLALVLPRLWFLVLLSVLAGTALLLDAVRTARRLRMQKMYREKETGKLSSITLFLISVLLMFVLFRLTTAALALVYLTVGDLSGKLTGLRFGRRKLLGDRTLEGSTGFVAGSLVCGYAMAAAFGEPSLPVVAVGAIAATGIELLTIGIDDNLTVGLGSAGVITLLTLI